ncbi:SDR family oxidoreductase [Virgibacillus salexigens]|uniref:3-beta hydroxysteroid dehydrogenase n=1 Tax=Virgibacillus kapii TaxID=1638645 RepID=A0ABQ2DYU7_9BACI|nr:SDR family oxidoreductase [Virgibacillus kapii]GGJ75397.1 3-beta hydroxysteroid dehydrogenase [Virgibacillus kapii]
MKRVLVAGATGYLGRYVVKELKRQGFYIKVLVRHPGKLNQTGNFLEPSIGEDVDEVAIGDITKPDTLKHICDNIDYVFSSVGITRKSNGLTFKDVDYQGNVNLLKEVENSHVAKFMYIHVCINDDWKEPGPLIEAKKRFVEVLTASNVDHIIIRPTGYFSDLTQFLTMAKKGRVYLIGDGKTRMNPIHGQDLAQFCIQSFSEVNQILDVGGPEILTYEQIAKLAFDVLDRKEHITHIPVGLLNSVSLGLRLFSKHNYGVLRFFMNVMTHNVTAPMYGKHKIKSVFYETI